ncbi:hypothetical protein CU254_42245 (plasmid) [Amycolatopsis sp. AA4]|nr:hypothetical protein CU254_42245 [Amycolatopsis sp. AA4]
MVSVHAPAVVLAGMVVHQGSRLCERGASSAAFRHAPVFAVQLSRRATVCGQVAALPAGLALALCVPPRLGAALAGVFVLWWLATVQRRLANHCWLSVVAVAGMALLPAADDAVLARNLLAGLYFSATLFKLNRTYLAGDASAGCVVARLHARLLGLRLPDTVFRCVPPLVVGTEFAVAVLLLDPRSAPVALVLACAMHGVFGITGNFPFSIVALGLWLVAFRADSRGDVVLRLGSAWPVVASALAAAAAAALLSRSPAGRTSAFVAGNAVLGAVFGTLCGLALAHAPEGDWDSAAVHGAVVVLFALNAVSVFLGWKLDWSFAMFSGLRPLGRSWIQRRRSRRVPRYYLLNLPEQVPLGLVRDIGARTLWEATCGGFAVHEAVAYWFERAARRHGCTFAPVAAERRGDVLVPLPGSGAQPRRVPLAFPWMIPVDFAVPYLG